MQKYNELESIYWNKNWNELQSVKEKGKAVEYMFEDENGKIIYPFIMRPANKVNQILYYDLVTARGQGGPRILKVSKNKENLIKNF